MYGQRLVTLLFVQGLALARPATFYKPIRSEASRASVCLGVGLALAAAFRYRFDDCRASICSGVAVASAAAILLALELGPNVCFRFGGRLHSNIHVATTIKYRYLNARNLTI